MSIPEIKLVSVPVDHEIPAFVPTVDDVESGIVKSIEERAQQILSAGNHRLLAFKAPIPHHPTDVHMIYWVDRTNGNGNVHPWDDKEWGNIASDHEFLEHIESLMRNLQMQDPKLRSYFFIGFVPQGADIDTKHMHPRGMQSQARMHIHMTRSLPRDVLYDRTLHPDNEWDKKQLALFANGAGEASIQRFADLLSGFGHKFIYTQHIGLFNMQDLERTIFGFSTLEEALQQSLALQHRVAHVWISHAIDIARKEIQLVGTTLSLMQSCVPNMVIIFPSKEDREYVGQRGNWPIWVMPFAVSAVQSVLTPGGVVIIPRKES